MYICVCVCIDVSAKHGTFTPQMPLAASSGTASRETSLQNPIMTLSHQPSMKLGCEGMKMEDERDLVVPPPSRNLGSTVDVFTPQSTTWKLDWLYMSKQPCRTKSCCKPHP